MSEKRVALDELANAIQKDDFIIAILPTGYGKTSFFEHHPDLITTKTVHVLPLQAIVQQFYQKMNSVLGDKVGYQMALQIADQKGKRPYLSRKYMITTVDSYVLDFYGIPVHEIFRSKWHSDLALLFARTSNLILDEFHLMAPVDIEDPKANTETEFVKVIEIFKHIIGSVSTLGLKTLILTATLSPYLLSYLFNSNQSQKKEIIMLAPRKHDFVEYIDSKYHIKVNAVWDENDDFISAFRKYTENVKTKIVLTDSKEWIEDVKNLIKQQKNRKILVILNHTSKVIRLCNELDKDEELKGKCVFIHGLFGDRSKTTFVNNLNNGKYNCVIATQVLEAGVDIDFDVLITDAAPAYSLIQRAGRVLRNPDRIKRGEKGEIYILKYSDIDKQVEFIYSKDLTLKTLDSLEKHKEDNESNNKIINVKINWRLPEIDNTYDYLKLLLDVDSIVENIIEKATKKENVSNKGIKSTLDFLSNVITSPFEAITTIDEKFKGSFIRSASLVSLVIKPDDKNEEIVTVSWDRFVKLMKRNKKLKFLYTVITEGGEKKSGIEVSENMIKENKPLTSLIRIMRRARKEEKIEDDFMSGYIKIIGKGFEIKDQELLKFYEDKEGNKYYYLDLSKISGVSGA